MMNLPMKKSYWSRIGALAPRSRLILRLMKLPAARDRNDQVAFTVNDLRDRVGGGDGFASGFFYGLMTGESPADAVKLGWAHGALLTTFPGDTTMATVEQVRAFGRSR